MTLHGGKSGFERWLGGTWAEKGLKPLA